MVLLRRWKLTLGIAIGVLIALYIVGYTLFNVGGTIPGRGLGDDIRQETVTSTGP